MIGMQDTREPAAAQPRPVAQDITRGKKLTCKRVTAARPPNLQSSSTPALHPPHTYLKLASLQTEILLKGFY